MSDSQGLMIILVVYKVATLLAGLSLAYMGYKLFRVGIFGDSGNLEVTWADTKVVLKRAAPGTFFVVLGTIVLVTTVWRGLTAETLNNMLAADLERRQTNQDSDISKSMPLEMPAESASTIDEEAEAS